MTLPKAIAPLQEELNEIINRRIDAQVLFSRARILWLIDRDDTL